MKNNHHDVPARPLKQVFVTDDETFIELIDKLLTLNPLSRCSASDALEFEYFKNIPLPTKPHLLPGIRQTVEETTTRKRKRDPEISGVAKKLVFV